MLHVFAQSALSWQTLIHGHRPSLNSHWRWHFQSKWCYLRLVGIHSYSKLLSMHKNGIYQLNSQKIRGYSFHGLSTVNTKENGLRPATYYVFFTSKEYCRIHSLLNVNFTLTL